MEVAIIDIVIPDNRKRAKDQKTIEGLADSIREVGLIQPVQVVPEDGHYVLVAGLHRLEACKLIGKNLIEATVQSYDDLHRELAEIDENLIRNELKVLERANHLARRKEIYEAMHPEAKATRDGGPFRGNQFTDGEVTADSATTSFTEDTASKTNAAARTIREDIQIAKGIAPEVQEQIKDTPLADSKSELLKLAKLEEPEQAAVVGKIIESLMGSAVVKRRERPQPADEDTGEAEEDGPELSEPEPKRKPLDVRGAVKELKREELLKNAPEAPVFKGEYQVDNIYVADVKGLVLPPDSMDLIFTDPPYHDEHLELYGETARLAVHVLKPGCYCLVYAGKMFLPEIIEQMKAAGLEYVWQFIVFHPFSQSRVTKHHIFENYRPILVFKKKGESTVREWAQDVIRGTRAKEQHDWQQDIEAPMEYIDKYTKPGAIVLDPFVGGGTIPFAAKKLQRHYLGFDVDAESARISLERLGEPDREE